LERERAVLQGKLQTEYSKVGKQNIGWLNSKIEEFKLEQTKIDKELSQAENLVDKTGEAMLTQKQRIEQLSIARTETRSKIAGIEQRMVQMKSEQNYLQYSGLKAVQAVLEERHRLGNIYGKKIGRSEENIVCSRCSSWRASFFHRGDSDRTAQTSINIYDIFGHVAIRKN
jgi:hypothetical protein